jgi:hypothetical protein
VAAAAANAGRPVSMGPATREAVRDARAEGSPRWPAGLAWALWLLTMLALAAVPWLDRLLRQAGRPDLGLDAVSAGEALATVAIVSALTVGLVLAARRPRHPVGWLLLAFGLSGVAAGVATGYSGYGLLGPPRLATRGRLGGHLRAARRHPDRRLPGAHPAAHPDWGAAVAALALVAAAHGGRAAGGPGLLAAPAVRRALPPALLRSS